MPNYPTGAIFPANRGRLIAKETIDNIQVIRLWLAPSNASNIFIRAFSIITYLFSFLLMAAPRIVFRKAGGVIISSPPLVNAWLAAIIARVGRKKIIVNISDIWPLTATEMGAIKQGTIFNILQKMERQFYQKASAFTGQSQEILDHIQPAKLHNKPVFLYRNLQDDLSPPGVTGPTPAKAKFIYAGNLGHAQGVLELCRNINPALINASVHIFGDGAERKEITSFIEQHPDKEIYLHPTISQQELNQELGDYTAMIIPLRTPIQGAVPSKLFMAITNNVPVLFCGGGEGAAIVRDHRLGLVSDPGDYTSLQQNMQKMTVLSDEEKTQLQQHLQKAKQDHFSKTAQDERYLKFLDGII